MIVHLDTKISFCTKCNWALLVRSRVPQLPRCVVHGGLKFLGGIGPPRASGLPNCFVSGAFKFRCDSLVESSDALRGFFATSTNLDHRIGFGPMVVVLQTTDLATCRTMVCKFWGVESWQLRPVPCASLTRVALTWCATPESNRDALSGTAF